MKKIFHTNNAEETKALAVRMVKTWRGGDVIGLVGELGAGKTTFAQGVARALGVKRAVRSPTFLRMQVYKIRNSKFEIRNFIHIDAYRIKKPEELLDLGLEDYLERKDALILIEWAEKIKKILPRRTRWIRFRSFSTPQHGRLLRVL